MKMVLQGAQEKRISADAGAPPRLPWAKPPWLQGCDRNQMRVSPGSSPQELVSVRGRTHISSSLTSEWKAAFPSITNTLSSHPLWGSSAMRSCDREISGTKPVPGKA